MKVLAAILIAAPMLLAGCATNQVNSQKQANQLSITYNSDPQGATLVQEDGKSFGEMPVTLNYSVSDAERAQGNKKLMGLTAKWPSGAHRSFPSMNVPAEVKNVGQFTFRRPDNAPHLWTDTEHARKLQQQAEQQRLAAQKAAEQRAAAQQTAENSSNLKEGLMLLGNIAQIVLGAKVEAREKAAATMPIYPPRPTNCTAIALGNDMASVSCH